MNRDHRQIEHPCHLGAQRRVGVEVAEHEPAAVEEYHRRAGLTRFARIEKPQRDRAGGAVHLEIFDARQVARSEEHTSELQSLMRISYAVFCLKKKKKKKNKHTL